MELLTPSVLRNRYLGPDTVLFKICPLKLHASIFPELLVGLSIYWSTLLYFYCFRCYITSKTVIKVTHFLLSYFEGYLNVAGHSNSSSGILGSSRKFCSGAAMKLVG